MDGREGSAKWWEDDNRGGRAREKLGMPSFGMACGEFGEMGETTCEYWCEEKR